MNVKVTHSCSTLYNPMDYTVHGIFQARILEWVAFPFSRGSFQPKDWTQVSCIAGRFFSSLSTSISVDFPGSSEVKASAYNAGDLGLVPGSGRFPGEGKGYPLQYSGLENSMDCIIHGVIKSWTWISDFHFHKYRWWKSWTKPMLT